MLARGVALRNVPLISGHDSVDYLLYIDGKTAEVIEAKKEDVALTGVEMQVAIRGQHKIGAKGERCLSVVEELEASVEANLKHADRRRQSVLQEAFAGGFTERGILNCDDTVLY